MLSPLAAPHPSMEWPRLRMWTPAGFCTCQVLQLSIYLQPPWSYTLSHEGSHCEFLLSRVVSDSVTPRTVDRQVPLSMGFSRQEYWSGLPCLSPGDLPNPRIKPAPLTSPALAGGFFTTSATWEALTESLVMCSS